MKRTTLYKYYAMQKNNSNAKSDENHNENIFTSPHCTLTKCEEQNVIEFIMERQRNYDCASIKDICDFGTSLLRNRDANAIELSYSWFKSFKKRYSNLIYLENVDSISNGRDKVKSEEVFEYFGKFVNALSQIKSLKQIINLDETGFSSRIFKGKKRKCVCTNEISIELKFKEKSQTSQLSVIFSINMSGGTLSPLYITKEKIKMNHDLQIINNYSKFYSTEKGYLNENAMIYWIQEIWKPYCENVRRELNDPLAKMFIIMDNCRVHSMQSVMCELNNIGNCEVIWLPPNSTHFLQPLDASFFGIIKSYYKNGFTPQTTPKVCGKIIRAFRAAWNACNPINIIKCWEMVGVRYNDMGSCNIKACIDISMVLKLVQHNCSDYQSEWIEE